VAEMNIAIRVSPLGHLDCQGAINELIGDHLKRHATSSAYSTVWCLLCQTVPREMSAYDDSGWKISSVCCQIKLMVLPY